jgi:hypothetical protein
VRRYDGYIVQSTGGGIFALFGAPVAHEDHPQRALYAALRLRQPPQYRRGFRSCWWLTRPAAAGHLRVRRHRLCPREHTPMQAGPRLETSHRDSLKSNTIDRPSARLIWRILARDSSSLRCSSCSPVDRDNLKPKQRLRAPVFAFPVDADQGASMSEGSQWHGGGILRPKRRAVRHSMSLGGAESAVVAAVGWPAPTPRPACWLGVFRSDRQRGQATAAANLDGGVTCVEAACFVTVILLFARFDSSIAPLGDETCASSATEARLRKLQHQGRL